MRVRELRLQVELEVGRVVHLLVAELDNLVAPALDRLAPNDRAEHSVDDQLDVLDHARRATLDARAEDRHDRLLAETHHFEAARLLVLLDPLDALQLRVDHERPARAARDDGAVLRRHRVGGQRLVVPTGHLSGRRENEERIQALLGHGHAALGCRHLALEVGQESLLHQRDAEALVEAANVRDEGRGEQHVAHEDIHLDVEVDDALLPACALGAKRCHQTLREAELAFASVRVGEHRLLLGDGGCEELLELSDSCLGGGLGRERRVLGGDGRVELLGGGQGLQTHGLDILVDVVVDVDVDDEVCETGGRVRLLALDLDVEPLELEQVLDVGEVGLGQLATVDASLEAEHGLEELGWRRHHGHRCLPARVNLLEGRVLGLQQADARGGHVIDALRRLLERLELAEILYVQALERGRGGDKRGLSRRQLDLNARLHLDHLLLLDRGGRGDLIGLAGLLAGLALLLLKLRDHGVNLGLLRLDLDGLDLQVLLELGDRRGSRLELDHAVREARNVCLGRLAPLGEHRLVECDQLEERLGRRVVEAALLRLVEL